MATVSVIPNAPEHMSDKAAKQWAAAYTKAFTQAKLDYPDNESAQRTVALKSANALLAVPAPTSADEIAKLQEWQVLLREDRTIKNVPTRVCVTVDGRKYAFPIADAAPQSVDLSKMTKEQLIAHAAEVHGLTLEPAAIKADLIAAIQTQAAVTEK
jgi:hypothetical protein